MNKKAKQQTQERKTFEEKLEDIYIEELKREIARYNSYPRRVLRAIRRFIRSI